MSVSRRAFARSLGTIPLLRAGLDHTLEQKTSAPETTGTTLSPPKLFDAHELATVAALAEIIIPATDTPGAREAKVAEYLDLILLDSPERVRTAFLEGLWWTDGYSQRIAGRPFRDLPAQEQSHLVAVLYDSAEGNQKTGREFVRSMKTWTAKIYYSTKLGEEELNKAERVPATYSGPCKS